MVGNKTNGVNTMNAARQTNNPEIAHTIRAQLGGGALMMLGAQMFVDVGDGLAFRIRGSKKANYIEIRLCEATDTYHMEIKKIGRAPSYTVRDVAVLDGLHVEDLHGTIEAHTGLYTRL